MLLLLVVLMHKACKPPSKHRTAPAIHNGPARARSFSQSPCARAANQGRAARLHGHAGLARKVSRLVMGGLREVDEFGANGWWCAPAPSRGWCHRLVKSCRHVAPQFRRQPRRDLRTRAHETALRRACFTGCALAKDTVGVIWGLIDIGLCHESPVLGR